MANLILSNLSKTYADKCIIDNLSLSIHDGELIVIVGPSGCGKSSLLRMIAGLEDVSAGTIAIDGRQVNHLEPKHRNIAMVFQNYALYPHMSVYDNMSYALRLRGVGKGEIAKQVALIAEKLELTDVLDRQPHELSGGQRQRVAMGRAMIREPDVFLFDEPLSNLDAKLRVQMRLEIKKMQRKTGVTSVYVTHDQIEAMTLADRLVVINRGRIEQIGTPLEVYNHPATIFTGSFIGSPAMNFIPVKRKGNRLFISADNELSLQVPETLPENIIIGVRPEKLHIKSSDEPAFLSIKIALVEALGADSLIHGNIVDTGHMITVRLKGTPTLHYKQIIDVAVDQSQLHLYDAKSEKRLDCALQREIA